MTTTMLFSSSSFLSLLLIILLSLLFNNSIGKSNAFIVTTRTSFVKRHVRYNSSSSLLFAKELSERQLQFFEDVEDGINEIESYYLAKKNDDEADHVDISKIRQFCASAKGEVSSPVGYALGHQPSEEHIEGLTAKPYWEANEFEWASKLEEKSQIIIHEFEQKLKNQENQLFTGDSVWQNNVMGAGWSAVRLQRLGEWNVKNCDEFPETYKLLKSLRIPLAVRGVCFARQSPGSGVAPHSDGRNFILTAHLGLQIPDNCWIDVGGERKSWTEGKLTIIDTSFEHSTGNSSDSDRHVLIIDFWHPELSEIERKCLEFVYDLRNKFESGSIPFRKPRSSVSEKEVQGLSGFWSALTGK